MTSRRYTFALVSAIAMCAIARGATPSKAYVALCCSTPATISVLDVATGAAIVEHPSAVGAAVMAPTPDHRAIYVLTQLYNGIPGEGWGPVPGAVNSIVVLNMEAGGSPTVIPLSAMPFAIAFSHSGNRAYVIAVDSDYGPHILVIDTRTKQVSQDHLFPSPSFGPGMQIIVSPDDSLLYLVDYDGAILKIGTRNFEIQARFACETYCQGLALVEQYKTLLTVDSTFNVDYIDAVSFQITKQVPFSMPAGSYAGGVIAVSSDGATAYMGSNSQSTSTSSVAALDIASATFTSTIAGMGISGTAAVSPDGTYLITDRFPTTLSILRLTPTIAGEPLNAITLSSIGSAFFNESSDRIYVLNAQSSYVSEIDAAAGGMTGRIPVGATPVSLAVEPARQRLYVANQMSGGLSVIDTATSTVLQNISLPWTGQYPQAIVPAGDNIFIADGEALQLLNLTTGAIKLLNFPNVGFYTLYRGIAVSPDSQWVYMAFKTATRNASGVTPQTGKITDGVDVYDAQTGALTNQIPITEPEAVAFSPDGAYAYVGSMTGNTLSLAVIDTSQQIVQRTIPIPAAQEILRMAVSPDGTTIYLLDPKALAVHVVDIENGQTIASISVGKRPSSLAISPDGTTIYVTDRASPVSIIATATNTVTGTISVGTGSTDVIFLPQ